MNENTDFHVERIDDIPVLWGQLERLQTHDCERVVIVDDTTG